MHIAAVTLGYQSFPTQPGYYWSSSEADNNNAKVQNLESGSTNWATKSNFNAVRAVRSF